MSDFGTFIAQALALPLNQQRALVGAIQGSWGATQQAGAQSQTTNPLPNQGSGITANPPGRSNRSSQKTGRGGGGRRGRGRGKGRGKAILTPRSCPALQKYLTWKGQNPGKSPRDDPVASQYYKEYRAELNKASSLKSEMDRLSVGSSVKEASVGASSSSSNKKRKLANHAGAISPNQGDQRREQPNQAATSLSASSSSHSKQMEEETEAADDQGITANPLLATQQ